MICQEVSLVESLHDNVLVLVDWGFISGTYNFVLIILVSELEVDKVIK